MATAASGNAGGATVSVGGVLNHAAATTMDLSHTSYQVSFTSGARGALQYEVVDQATSSVVASGAYHSDMNLQIGGSQVSFKGFPVLGDSFTIPPRSARASFRPSAICSPRSAMRAPAANPTRNSLSKWATLSAPSTRPPTPCWAPNR